MITAKPIPKINAKIFDIEVNQSHDLVKFLRGTKTRHMHSWVERGISRGLVIAQKQTISNMTKMKAVLSGWGRNSFKRFLYRPNQDALGGKLYSDVVYLIYVHEGLFYHSQGGYTPPKGEERWGPVLVPNNIFQLQKKLLKIKKTIYKGPRPFFKNAIDEKQDEIQRIVATNVSKGLEVCFNRALRSMVRGISKKR